MNAAVSVTNHPDDETLAAFVDGRLDATAREEVMKHTVDCAECRDVVLLSTEIVAAEGGASNVVRPRVWPRVAAFAAAAAVAVVFLATPLRERVLTPGAMREVAATAASLEQRQTDARLSFDRAHKPAKQRFRGSGDRAETPIEAAEVAIDVAVAKAASRVEKKPTPENRHALGLALLMDGKPSEAIEELERAASAKPSVAVLNDLAAAYLQRASEGDYAHALTIVDRSLQLERTVAGAWNRALALERLHRYDMAIAAWQEYIRVEADPAWDAEASKRIADLQDIRRIRPGSH
jgi:tetratricopeptide (TPR) repeat protein